MVVLFPTSLSLTKRREKYRYEDGDDDDEGVEERCFVMDFEGKVDEFMVLMEGKKT